MRAMEDKNKHRNKAVNVKEGKGSGKKSEKRRMRCEEIGWKLLLP